MGFAAQGVLQIPDMATLRDGNLITGQQQFSGGVAAELVVQAHGRWSKRARVLAVASASLTGKCQVQGQAS